MQIASMQHALPRRLITNDAILREVHKHSAKRLTPDRLALLEKRLKTFLKACGTEVRYALDDGERAIDVVCRAARAALARANIAPESVEFLIYTGVGRGWIEPATAGAVQAALGLTDATCFDVMDACASWLRALQIAHTYLRAGVYRRGMIVNCECGLYRAYADWAFDTVEELDLRFAQYTIGEAATATIVTEGGEPDDFHFTFRSFGEHLDLCMIPLPVAADFLPHPLDPRYVPGRFIARSRELLDTASRLIVETFQADPRLVRQRYDIAFGHEASAKVSEIVTTQLGVGDVYFPTHSRFGNTVSASVPLAMSVAMEEARLRRGDHVLVIMGSAGITVGLASFTL